MRRKRLLLVACAAVLVIAAGVVWWAVRDTPDRVARRVANAWASGDVAHILRYAPAAERALLSESQLRAVYQKAILDEFGNLTLKSLEKEERDEHRGEVIHVFVATYALANGSDFEVEIIVSEKRAGFTVDAVGTLRFIYHGEAMGRALATGEYDGSYPSYIKVISSAWKRAKGRLREAGVEQIYLGEGEPMSLN